MYSGRDHLAVGLPHSEIRGSTIARISPQLIAACHVLHRLLVPRHPPNPLLCLMLLSRVDDPSLRIEPPVFHMQRRTCSDQARVASNSHQTRRPPRMLPAHDPRSHAPRIPRKRRADDRRTLFTISDSRRGPQASPPECGFPHPDPVNP